MCHLSPQDQHVCQSHHGIAEAITGVLGRAQFPSCSFYHPISSRSRFRPTRKAAICAGNFPDSNGIVMISKGKHVPIRLNQCLLASFINNRLPVHYSTKRTWRWYGVGKEQRSCVTHVSMFLSRPPRRSSER